MNKKINGLITALFFIILTAYIVARASNLSITHDESLSYTMVTGNDTWKGSANNHMLNTLLMSGSAALFGPGEFALRLPNVLAFILYFFACFYICRSVRNSWVFFLGMCLMLLNPFLLEFFSLARGYGLALGFILLSMYFLFRNGSYKNFNILRKDFVFAVLFASLAVYANLGLINYLIAVMLLFVFKYLLFKREKQKIEPKSEVSFWIVLLLSLFPLFLGVQHLLNLQAGNQLYFGAETFMEGFDSLIFSSVSPVEYYAEIKLLIKMVLAIFLSVGLVSVIYKKAFQSRLLLAFLLISILGLGLFFENVLFGAKYPIDRTALYYIPVIGLFVFYLFSHLLNRYPIKRWLYIPVVFLLTGPLILNFAASVNFTTAKSWHYEKHTKEVMNIVKEQLKEKDSIGTISNHWVFEPSFNYYISTGNINLEPANRDGINENSDFIYILEDSIPTSGYRVLKSFPDINSYLLMREMPED